MNRCKKTDNKKKKKQTKDKRGVGSGVFKFSGRYVWLLSNALPRTDRCAGLAQVT